MNRFLKLYINTKITKFIFCETRNIAEISSHEIDKYIQFIYFIKR
jgi:hypothetical protein